MDESGELSLLEEGLDPGLEHPNPNHGLVDGSGQIGGEGRGGHWAVYPPSIARIWPVIIAAASEARNTTGRATSMGSPS